MDVYDAFKLLSWQQALKIKIKGDLRHLICVLNKVLQQEYGGLWGRAPSSGRTFYLHFRFHQFL